jgi:DNA topoisomerase-1
VQVAEGGPGRTASLPEDVAPADFPLDAAMDLLKAKAEGPRPLGVDPKTGQNVYVMNGRFGPYVQLGEMPEKDDTPKGKGGKAAKPEKPKRASLGANMTESTVTLADALRLLDLPREIGKHPDDGAIIVANFGRFGPYIKHNDEFRSLENEQQVFDVTLDQAVELFRQPKKSRRQSAARTVLNALGARPDSGKAMQVLSGRYGPYVTDGTTNASLPKGKDPAKLTIEEAVELLKAREAAGPPAPKAGRRGGGMRRAAAKPAGAAKKTKAKPA